MKCIVLQESIKDGAGMVVQEDFLEEVVFKFGPEEWFGASKLKGAVRCWSVSSTTLQKMTEEIDFIKIQGSFSWYSRDSKCS